MAHKCAYCESEFASAAAFNRHKNRMTGCISWECMHNLFQEKELDIAELQLENTKKSDKYKHDLDNLIETLKKTVHENKNEINDLKIKNTELNAKFLMKEEAEDGFWRLLFLFYVYIFLMCFVIYITNKKSKIGLYKEIINF